MRKSLLAAALAAGSLALLAATARAGALPTTACASGYHPDRGGNCQPNGGQTNRYCPAGTVFHTAFNGWTCDPPPPEAY